MFLRVGTVQVSPRVSVVMPVHNAAAFLADAVLSIQAQSFQDWELIAVDDASTDESPAILARLATGDPRITVVTSTTNLGAGASRNLAMDRAGGRWLAFLDADDLWHPEKLDRQIAVMEKTAIPISCTAYLRVNVATGQQTVVGVPPRANRRDLLKTNTVALSSAMIDSAFFGPRRMAPKRREDYRFWLQLLEMTPEVIGIGQVLMTYRQHPRSLSASKLKVAAFNWDIYRHELGLSLIPAMWYFGNYALRGLLRHRLPGLARGLGWLHRADDS